MMSHLPSKCNHDSVIRLGSGEVIKMFWNELFPPVKLVIATRLTFRSKAMVQVPFALVSSITAWSLSGSLTTFACASAALPSSETHTPVHWLSRER